MDIREKLVGLLECITGCAVEDCRDCELNKNIEQCVEFRKKWRTDKLLANGVTVLPCKLGDMAWGIKRCHLGNAVKQGEVYQMYFGEEMRLCICVKNVCRGEWGVNVFGTKEEAEEAVGKMAKKE